MYELVIIWSNGDKDIYTYPTQNEAENAELGMRTAFGNQISWSCTREKRG